MHVTRSPFPPLNKKKGYCEFVFTDLQDKTRNCKLKSSFEAGEKTRVGNRKLIPIPESDT